MVKNQNKLANRTNYTAFYQSMKGNGRQKASIMILQHAVLRKKDIGMTKCIIEALQRLLGRMKQATAVGFRDSPQVSPSP